MTISGQGQNHGNLEAKIKGLDENGFLTATVLDTGSDVKLSPNENSFDLMSGLVAIKN